MIFSDYLNEVTDEFNISFFTGVIQVHVGLVLLFIGCDNLQVLEGTAQRPHLRRFASVYCNLFRRTQKYLKKTRTRKKCEEKGGFIS